MISNNLPSSLILIDDDPALLQMVKALIEKHFDNKIRVDVFDDPQLANERIQDWDVDMVITDLEMPNLNGIDILKKVKSRNPFAQVILMTGHSQHEAVIEALEQGASDYLLKPVNKTQLWRVLEQGFERQLRWLSALDETWNQQRNSSRAESAAGGDSNDSDSKVETC